MLPAVCSHCVPAFSPPHLAGLYEAPQEQAGFFATMRTVVAINICQAAPPSLHPQSRVDWWKGPSACRPQSTAAATMARTLTPRPASNVKRIQRRCDTLTNRRRGKTGRRVRRRFGDLALRARVRREVAWRRLVGRIVRDCRAEEQLRSRAVRLLRAAAESSVSQLLSRIRD